MKYLLAILLFSSSLPIASQWVNYNNLNIPELHSNEIRSIAADDDGILWFGTSNGLVSFNGQQWTRYSKENHSLADNSINQLIFHSEDKSLRLATDRGSNILALQGGLTVEATYQRANSGIYDDKVYSVGVTKEGIQAFGTGKGFSVYNNTVWGSLKNLLSIDSLKLANFPVKSIASTSSNSFITSDGRGIYLASNEVDGMSYVTTWVFPYNLPASDNVRTAFVDASGNQWYGTDQGAVFHEGIQAQQGWSDPYTTESGLPDNSINSIMEDSFGNIWFGTENGVAVKKNDNTWTVFSTADGLISNKIFDIAEDKQQNIWFATEAGISRLKPSWLNNSLQIQPAVFKMKLHPNPARESVWIKYHLPSSGPLKLSVYDISGKQLVILENKYCTGGEHEFLWNIIDSNGFSPSPGIYYLRMEAGLLSTTTKLIILK